MSQELKAISNTEIKSFYERWTPHRAIIREFYHLLPEDLYDYRMVDKPDRKSDSPRESLVHIILTQYQWLTAIQTGHLDYAIAPSTDFNGMSKEQLLSELDTQDREMLHYFTDKPFEGEAKITTSWGDDSAANILALIRGHDILHAGWNLALLDHLGMERFQSLSDFWG